MNTKRKHPCALVLLFLQDFQFVNINFYIVILETHHLQKTCIGHKICLTFLYKYDGNVFRSDKYLMNNTRAEHTNACKVSGIVVRFNQK
jgi:hypothetical protein